MTSFRLSQADIDAIVIGLMRDLSFLTDRAIQAKSLEFRRPMIAYVDRVNEIIKHFQAIDTSYALVSSDKGSTSEQVSSGKPIEED